MSDSRNDREIYEEDFVPIYDETSEHANHSIDQVDLMVYGLAAGGIYACFQIMKFCVEESIAFSKLFLMIIGCLFLSTIVLQLLSSWYGFATSWYKLSHMSKGENWKLYIDPTLKMERKDFYQNTIVHFMNAFASLTLISGLVCVVIFMALTF